ncbi:MAG: archease [Dehalococcoidales bacterium]
MKRFELFEHTADTGFIAYGRTLAEAFSNAALAMFSVMADLDEFGKKETVTVEVCENDLEILLVEWLNSLLFYFDTQGIVFTEFNVISISKNCLKAECRGEKYNPNRHSLKLGVKSATYHMLKVDTVNNTVRVILDI